MKECTRNTTIVKFGKTKEKEKGYGEHYYEGFAGSWGPFWASN
jgi:hypothetical protein